MACASTGSTLSLDEMSVRDFFAGMPCTGEPGPEPGTVLFFIEAEGERAVRLWRLFLADELELSLLTELAPVQSKVQG
jgi:hypothetical protein